MFDNAYGCAAGAISIRRNAFLAIFISIELILSELQNIKMFTSSVCVTSYLSNESKIYVDMLSITHLNTGIEKCQFNIGS